MQADVAPLRVHLHQETLEFLRSFFTYKPVPSQLAKDLPVDPDAYIQSCTIHTFDMKFDYVADHVDFKSLGQGDYVQVINFVPVRNLELSLKQVDLHGVRGFPAMIEQAALQWASDIYATQKIRIVAGLPGARPVANIGSAVVDLVRLPMEEYRRHGRYGHGLKQGAELLVKKVTVEGLDVASVRRFVGCIYYS